LKATIDKSDLLRAVQTAERAVSTKSSLPVLSAMLLEVVNDCLLVKATDLEVSVETHADVDSAKSENGAVAVPAKQFVEYVRAMPGDSVSLTVEDRTMIVKSGRSRIKLQVFSREEFPALAPVESQVAFTVNEKALAETLGRTVIAASGEDTRPSLCGVLWKLTEGAEDLKMVATDTHRLHIAACPIRDLSGAEDVLVSARTCRELQRLLGANQDCRVIVDKNQVQVITDGGTLVGRRLEGTFPKYERVVPDYTDYLGMNRDDLAEVVKRAGIVGQHASNRILLEFKDAATLEITADAADQGRAEEEIEFSGTLGSGFDTQLAANWRFLLETIQACPDEALRFYHQQALRPILLTGVDPSRFLAVIMPMSLQ
jgi:DNA polymerase III subunit beta